MTSATLSLSSVHPSASPPSWAGRILGGVVDGFLALEGASRLLWTRPLVTPSEAAPTLEASLQSPLGAVLLLGAALYLVRPARLLGAALLLLGLSALIAVEAAADVRSPAHMLFWAYVGGLLVAGYALRRASLH